MVRVHGFVFEHSYFLRGQTYRLTGWFGWCGSNVVAELSAEDGAKCIADTAGTPSRCIVLGRWYQVIPSEPVKAEPWPWLEAKDPAPQDNNQEGQEQ